MLSSTLEVKVPGKRDWRGDGPTRPRSQQQLETGNERDAEAIADPLEAHARGERERRPRSVTWMQRQTADSVRVRLVDEVLARKGCLYNARLRAGDE